jgi:hypothetical protein
LSWRSSLASSPTGSTRSSTSLDREARRQERRRRGRGERGDPGRTRRGDRGGRRRRPDPEHLPSPRRSSGVRRARGRSHRGEDRPHPLTGRPITPRLRPGERRVSQRDQMWISRLLSVGVGGQTVAANLGIATAFAARVLGTSRRAQREGGLGSCRACRRRSALVRWWRHAEYPPRWRCWRWF